jgi:hypothetical protein
MKEFKLFLKNSEKLSKININGGTLHAAEQFISSFRMSYPEGFFKDFDPEKHTLKSYIVNKKRELKQISEGDDYEPEADTDVEDDDRNLKELADLTNETKETENDRQALADDDWFDDGYGDWFDDDHGDWFDNGYGDWFDDDKI